LQLSNPVGFTIFGIDFLCRFRQTKQETPKFWGAAAWLFKEKLWHLP